MRDALHEVFVAALMLMGVFSLAFVLSLGWHGGKAVVIRIMTRESR